MNAPGKSSRHIAWGDTARALAMIWIVGFWHAIGGYSPHCWERIPAVVPFHVLSGVTTGVLGAFMFLSSFLICSHRSFPDRNSAIAFYGGRFTRVFPLYFLALATFPHAGFDGHGIAVRLLALFGLSQYVAGHGITTLWFISVLVSFYALLPAINADWLSARRRIALGLLCLAAMFGMAELAGSDPRIPLCFTPFLMGAWISRTAPSRPLFATAALSAAWGAALWIPGDGLLRAILLSALGWAPLKLVSIPLSKVPGSGGFWRFLAYVSFAAYLFHRHLYKLFVHFLPPEGPFRPLVVVAAGFPFVLAVSFLVQRFGDEAAARLRPRRTTGPSPRPCDDRDPTTRVGP